MVNRSSLAKLAEVSDFDFPALMKLLRERKDLSARKLSQLSGLSPAYISKMEKGDLLPTLDAFAKIIDNLDCSDAEIVFVIRSLNKSSNLSLMR